MYNCYKLKFPKLFISGKCVINALQIYFIYFHSVWSAQLCENVQQVELVRTDFLGFLTITELFTATLGGAERQEKQR